MQLFNYYHYVFHLESYFGQGIKIFAFLKILASKQLNLAEADVFQFFFSYFLCKIKILYRHDLG